MKKFLLPNVFESIYGLLLHQSHPHFPLRSHLHIIIFSLQNYNYHQFKFLNLSHNFTCLFKTEKREVLTFILRFFLPHCGLSLLLSNVWENQMPLIFFPQGLVLCIKGYIQKYLRF